MTSPELDPERARLDHLALSAVSRGSSPTVREGTSGGAALRVLLVARLFGLPYRVLRCLRSAGADVHVLGAEQAKPLALSRYCQQFHASRRRIDGAFDAELANEINTRIAGSEIAMVLAGDAPSTRSLIAIRDFLDAPCFPMPELAQFDLLNNKWRFGALCRSLAIDTPDTKLFSDAKQLTSEIDSAEIRFPKIAKPLSMDGGGGVIKLEAKTARARASQISYSPIIIQEFVEGEDIHASVFCERGEIKAFIAYRFDGAEFTAFFDQAIYDDVGKITRTVKVDGVLNFDMLRGDGKRISFLECNPRFFHRMAMSMVAGMNFVSYGLPNARAAESPEICPSRSLQFRIPNPRPLLLGMLKPWKLRLLSLDALKYLLADPLPSLRKKFGPEDEPEIDLLNPTDFPLAASGRWTTGDLQSFGLPGAS